MTRSRMTAQTATIDATYVPRHRKDTKDPDWGKVFPASLRATPHFAPHFRAGVICYLSRIGLSRFLEICQSGEPRIGIGFEATCTTCNTSHASQAFNQSSKSILLWKTRGLRESVRKGLCLLSRYITKVSSRESRLNARTQRS